MFDYQSLLTSKTNVYVKIPAKSRKQSFILYEIIDSAAAVFDDIAANFKFRYLTLSKPGTNLVLVPFENSLTSAQLEDLDFGFPNDKLKVYDYAHSYRERTKSSNGTVTNFQLHNANAKIVDALTFVQDQKMYFNSSMIEKALKVYIKSEEYRRIINNDIKLRGFLHALANDIYRQLYTQADLKMILDILKPSIPKLVKQYGVAYHEIENSTALRSKTNPFGQYLKMYHVSNKDSENITQQMLSMMAEDFEANPKLDLSIAADLIAQIYPPALIAGSGNDKDNVVIFNPLEGIWIHDENIFYSLLTAIRPYSRNAELGTMIATFGAQARNKNSFIVPYHESRYLPFKNLVLDLKTKIQYTLSDDKVKDLHFTERDQINLDYDPAVQDSPEFPGELSNMNAKGNYTWDPWTFFMAYADNDKERFKFLMFCLSLGLFAGHNFGIHVNIKGESRWGKTIISEIFKQLFSNRVFAKSFSTLNGQFGFTSYKPDTSVIWIDECNVDADPLNSEYGTQVYDALANNQASLQVKNDGDLLIANPPQMYIDGTSFVKAKDMDTGPAGRTLVYKLPMEDDSVNPLNDLINQAYAKNIAELLHDEAVLQFLVNSMIEAYETCLSLTAENHDRLWNLKLNLGGHSGDNKILPDFARDWRREMAKTQGGDIQEWFEYDFMPYFSTDPNAPTKMHDDLAYTFYATDYKTRYSRQDPNNQYILSSRQFTRQFKNLLTENGWSKVEIREANGRVGRQSNKYLSKLNFNEQDYTDAGNMIPVEFTKENIDSERPLNSFPLGRNVTGWYKIMKVED